SAVDAAPSTTGNVKITPIGKTALNIVSAYSSTGTASSTQSTLPGGLTGYVSLVLSSARDVGAGLSEEYDVELNFVDLNSTAGQAYGKFQLHLQETDNQTSSGWLGIETGSGDAASVDHQPSFIWSDNSNTSHTQTTSDWNNGRYVEILPSNQMTVSN
ncbi:MAG: hypothetical protein Q8R20_01285, partial [Nanoarchaeota archaeon]|nr:hypothetical protein [Nanoarchaeota archaeon]